MECNVVDQEWMDLWQSDGRISHSSSYYSLPPIDEEYEWSTFDPQLAMRLNRGVSAITLPPIGEEMSNYVCNE